MQSAYKSLLVVGVASRLVFSFMHSPSTRTTATAVATSLQVSATSHRKSRHFSSKAPLSQSGQQQAMSTYWRSLLNSARVFGAQRPATLLLSGAAVGAGVWVAQVCCWCSAAWLANEHKFFVADGLAVVLAWSPLWASAMQQLCQRMCRQNGGDNSSGHFKQPAVPPSPRRLLAPAALP
jgi:hypothetical protein